MSECLELREVSKYYNGRRVLAGVNLTVAEREIVGIIGPNGAGKTTLFNLVTGLTPVSSGQVLFHGRDITGWPPHRLCHAGLARTFQIPRMFPEMTALENILVGAWFGKPERAARPSQPWPRQEARELLALVGLPHKADTVARDLTLSEQRRLEVARALATRPCLLLLDEIAAGLSPKAVKQVVELVDRLRERGLTLLIIDHFLNLTLKVSDRMVALDQGEIIAYGPPSQVMHHSEVLSAYLGVREG